jgi:hypothetical protein
MEEFARPRVGGWLDLITICGRCPVGIFGSSEPTSPGLANRNQEYWDP